MAFGLTMRRFTTELDDADRLQWEIDGQDHLWGCKHGAPRILHAQRHWPQTIHPPAFVGGPADPETSGPYLAAGIAPIETLYDAASDLVTFTYDYFPVAGHDEETGIEMHEYPPRQDAHAADPDHPYLIAHEAPLPLPGTAHELLGHLRWHVAAPNTPRILLRWWRKSMYVNHYPWGPP